MLRAAHSCYGLFILVAITFCCSTATVLAPLVGQRIFPFPESYGLTLMQVGDDGYWHDVVPSARGRVVVRKDKLLRLQVDTNYVRDLSFLSSLAPDDLDLIEFDGLLLPSEEYKHIERLHVPELSFQAESIDNDGLEHVGNMVALKGLAISTGVSEDQIDDRGIAFLGRCKSLEALSLCNVPKVSDRGLAALADLKKLKDLALWQSGITDAGLKCLGQMSQLQDLSLGASNIGDKGIVQLQYLTGLKTLSLAGTRITKAAFKYLARLVNLDDLDLGGTIAGSADMTELKPLKKVAWVQACLVPHVFTAKAIWDPPDYEKVRELLWQDTNDNGLDRAKIISNYMRKLKAPQAAIEFVTFMILSERGGGDVEFMTSFKRYRNIGVIETTTFNMYRPSWSYMVNGLPNVVSVEAGGNVNWEQAPLARKLLKQYPKAGLGDNCSFQERKLLPSGAQRFIFRWELNGGNHATPSGYDALIAFDFAPNRRYVGCKSLGVVPYHRVYGNTKPGVRNHAKPKSTHKTKGTK